MTARELTVAVEDVTAEYDHAGRLEAVDLRLSYETLHETNVGKRRVTYGAPRFRFAVDGDGTARLAEIESRSHDQVQDESNGTRIADFRAIPAAREIVAGIGDVEDIEAVATSVDDRIAEIGDVTFENE